MPYEAEEVTRGENPISLGDKGETVSCETAVECETVVSCETAASCETVVSCEPQQDEQE